MSDCALKGQIYRVTNTLYSQTKPQPPRGEIRVMLTGDKANWRKCTPMTSTSLQNLYVTNVVYWLFIKLSWYFRYKYLVSWFSSWFAEGQQKLLASIKSCKCHGNIKICNLRISSWNNGTMLDRASKVVKTMGRRCIYKYCIQEWDWKGCSVRLVSSKGFE